VKIRVKLFAAARQTVGRGEVEVELSEPATVGQLRAQLARQLPQLAGLIGHASFALDARYADDAEPLPAGAEVACIPPVSGG